MMLIAAEKPRERAQPVASGSPIHGLWSLWDMLILDAEQFISLLHTLLSTELMARGQKGPLPSDRQTTLLDFADTVKKRCEELELWVSARTADNMIGSADSSERVHDSIRQVTNSITLELQGRQFYGVITRFLGYHDKPQLLGEDVFNNFPSAKYDIYEAGMCLAFERPTACVMHLMRVLETGLTVLAETLGLSKQNDWGSFLRKIDAELNERAKTSGARSADEQFYAEAAINFDRMRRAWRNPTMHPDKSYSQDRAEEILISVRSFMAHLATKLHE
jgi:hypothetical protein